MRKRTYDGEPLDATMQPIAEAPRWQRDGETVDVVDRETSEVGQETVHIGDAEEAIRAIRDEREAETDAEEMPAFMRAIERAIGKIAAESTVADAGSLGYLLSQYRLLLADVSVTTSSEQRTLADYAKEDTDGGGRDE